ncbi:MAG: tRNA (guanine-N1)-methyltransferase [Candidatus Saganbacteria bacterium]|uniref:tRNA (guanine-N(1)-)-methyltransferase n=1 Tax=Candidatus Saganbacteria bacterium TaxID=2575572 RepID=A0A833L1I0_UNCSA|nr:MAG: tRNA (guanine-N1)-methyltransferase [Candidatus Saganbacteria bacterium]
MRVDVLTLFPKMFEGSFSESLMSRAQEKGLFTLHLTNIRDFTQDKHQTADDSPYGGGSGMVMKPEPIFEAVNSLNPNKKARVILMCPSGEPLTQQKVIEFSKEEHLIIICGHYEGFDERVRENLATDEISIGDYVLTGGELPAMVLIDSVVRQIPGVVKEEESLTNESYYNGLLDYPSYTRPEEFSGLSLPDVLKSGHHKEIAQWRKKEALTRTFFRRPDLIAKMSLTEADKAIIAEIING